MAVVTITSTSSSAPTPTVTSSASANTLGSFATLGTTSADIDELFVLIRTSGTANRDFYLQLYTNDSGSDTALGDMIPVRMQSNLKRTEFHAAVHIPSGTTIKAKCMDSTGSGTLLCEVRGVESGSTVPTGAATGANAWKFVGLPATTASAVFLSCDSDGTTANVFKSNTVGTTSADANAIGVLHRTSVSAAVDLQFRILDDGAVIQGNTHHRGTTGDNFVYSTGLQRLSSTVASGSSITAEVACSGITLGSREIGLAVYFQNLPSLGGSSSTIIQGSGMQRILKDGETTAGRKRVFFDIRDTAGAGWTGSVTGVKAKLSTNGGTAADSTNDIVRVTTPLHYVELSDVEAAAASAGDVIAAWVPAGSGYLASTIGYLEITSENPTTQTVTDIANAVVEAEITALKTYNRSADTTATIDGPTSGSNSLTVTTDAAYNPIKTF